MPIPEAQTANLAARVLALTECYNRTLAKPFKWTYQGKALAAQLPTYLSPRVLAIAAAALCIIKTFFCARSVYSCR
jgi:hypothetical protein